MSATEIGSTPRPPALRARPLPAIRLPVSPGQIAALVLMLLLTTIAIYPLVWLVTNSFKSAHEMFDQSWALPEIWRWDNYRQAWAFGLGRYMINSLIVTGVSVLLIVLIGALGAFALTALQFPGKRLVYAFILGGMILPPELSLFPLFKILNAIGLYNTYGAMIVPSVAFGLPFTIFLLRAYMVTIPHELHEAAVIDGASLGRIFWSIYLPLTRPALASAALIMGMRVWNEFVFALNFVESNSLRTLTIGISTFGDALRVDWAVLMAGLVISVVPVLATFLAMQRQFLGSLTQGAVK